MINKLIAAIIPKLPKSFVWIFSKKYIAGEKLDDALNAAKRLNSEGCSITVDLLGEYITDMNQAEENKKAYLEIIEKFEQNKINGNYSIKPTFFGLLIDENSCFKKIYEVVEKAASYNNFVRIDMEHSACTDLEFDLFNKLRKTFPKNVGICVQSYLIRTQNDLRLLFENNNEERPLNFRLCKGIYIESPQIAYQKYHEINDSFILSLDYMLKNGAYVGIATHDRNLINASCEIIEKNKISKDQYEFQMLYGVTPNRKEKLLQQGHPLKIYIPFGKEWFNYSTRRLKENPKLISHIVKSIFN